MTHSRARVRRSAAAVVLALAVAVSVTASGSVAGSAASTPSRPLQTAVADTAAFAGPGASLAMRRVRAAGATMAKLVLFWNQVAPAGTVKPGGFNPSNPADPRYRWAAFDRQVKTAVAAGLTPYVVVVGAPRWAEESPATRRGLANWNVSAVELGRFATAAARRYNGSSKGLPRVRYWEIWDEPNLSTYLNPQLSTQLTKTPRCPFVQSQVTSADLYRSMVNSAAAAIHAVRSDDVVVAGGLAPFCSTNGVVEVSPLMFMRRLLCMSGGAKPKPTCKLTTRFDVWAVNPYTSGGPTHKASLADDVSLGNLPAVATLLKAAVKAQHVVARGSVGFWVTEFGWDTKPPDPYGVPLSLHARWVAEALYRAWSAGITVFTWYPLRDEASGGRPPGDVVQGGLYFRGASLAKDRPKPALNAFRFPFVAFRQSGKILVWGRTPSGKAGSVIVEQAAGGGGWKRLGELKTDRNGIFTSRLGPAAGATGTLVRARLVGSSATAVPFSLIVPPDRVVNPFGGPPGRG